MLTESQLRKISKTRSPKQSLLDSILAIADQFKPHQLAHVLAQVMHESGGLKFDREIWGPTDAQKRYEGRKDLGNTQKGDGSKFRGYGPIQLTGRRNVTDFLKWCQKRGLNPPDFLKTPNLIATSPWAGWSVVWYWEVGNPTGKSLNRYADMNDIEMVTRRVNGGLNGFEDRLTYYDRAALVLLGLSPTGISEFQASVGLKVDGVSGPQTRAAMHKRLVALVPGEAAKPEVKLSPVTEEKPVVPKKVEQEVKQKTNWLSTIFGGIFGGGGFAAWLAGMDRDALILVAVIALVVVAGVLIGGRWLVRRVKDIRQEIEA
jgi:putative chitinase